MKRTRRARRSDRVTFAHGAKRTGRATRTHRPDRARGARRAIATLLAAAASGAFLEACVPWAATRTQNPLLAIDPQADAPARASASWAPPHEAVADAAAAAAEVDRGSAGGGDRDGIGGRGDAAAGAASPRAA
jgi:hypothetical protein